MTRGLLTSAALAAAVAAGAAHLALGPTPPAAARPSSTEVIVTLAAPAIGHAHDRASVKRLDAGQRAFASALHAELPSARIRWRYRLVLDGAAIVLPDRDVGRLRRLPGVTAVYPSTTSTLPAGVPSAAGTPPVWAPGLPNDGAGMKIGIIDGGVEQSHPYFDPTGYTMPAGFPKGQVAYTSAKVIVARAFPPPGPTTPAQRVPYDASESSYHGTHVAGIAAGDAATSASGGALVSGVAPRAYIGNYRAYTIPTDSGVGDDGNTPEVVAAIEAAVADGMDVINLSIGEPETTRDPIALALDGAAAAGVVPVVAAGNDFEDFGRGSATSPGSSARAITVGAVSSTAAGTAGVIGYFSSAGPTPISLRLKPDVVAPGIGILSAIPGGWTTMMGTSMASPQVAGAAALLRQLHPDWTVAQLKSALVETGDDVWATDDHTATAPPTRAGGGEVNLPRAADPVVFSAPSSLSFGLLRTGTTATQTVAVTDAGGGAGTWTVAVAQLGPADGVTVSTPPTVDVPGSITVTATADSTAPERDVSGYVLLSKIGTSGTDVRRIPFWFRVTKPLLETEQAITLTRPGTYTGTTRGGPSRVSSYRYPDVPGAPGLAAVLGGPERVYRIVLRRAAANFGVAIVARGRGVTVVPRVVSGDDENRLTGYPGLPVVLNPYLAALGEPVLSAGALLPTAGTYDLVFDSPTAAGAGRFTFRYWVSDVTPPSARLDSRTVAAGRPLVIRVADGQSGVDPDTIVARIDGKTRRVAYASGRARVDGSGLVPGRHRLTFQVSDYQETRNMENVSAVLPNTRRLVATIVVR